MRPLKLISAAAVLTLAMAATPAFAQPPSQQPPATTPPTQQPPATTPPTQQPPATTPPPTAQPPRPFPQGSKIAYIDIQAVASQSATGKEASQKLQALQQKKVAEIGEKNKQLQALQSKLQQGGSVLNESARSQLEKDIDKLQRDIQFSQQNAQAEFNDLQNELQADFQKKLMPIIEQVANEKGLLMVFSIRDSGIAWAEPGLDVSDEVAKKLDAANPGAAKK
jgi:Skp family chaperone for outer membrane proteins